MSGDVSYEITIYCPTCKRMVYEERGIGGDNYSRLIVEARDALHNQLNDEHPDHGLKLSGKTKALGYPTN
jgi:hypothetical protein